MLQHSRNQTEAPVCHIFHISKLVKDILSLGVALSAIILIIHKSGLSLKILIDGCNFILLAARLILLPLNGNAIYNTITNNPVQIGAFYNLIVANAPIFHRSKDTYEDLKMFDSNFKAR